MIFFCTFNYNNQDQLTSVDIDGNEVVEYTYVVKHFNGEDYLTNLIETKQYANGDKYTFSYNDEDQLISMKFKDESENRYEYQYDSSARLSVVKDIFNQKIYYYRYDLSSRLTKVTDEDGNVIIYDYDDQGNVVGLMNESGSVVVEYIYDAWGNIISQSSTVTGLDEINPYRYRGYRYDVDTGLYYLQSRYYDPNIGRFINLYVYSFNNPIMYINPSGHDVLSILLTAIIIGAIAGGFYGGVTAHLEGQNVLHSILIGAAIGAQLELLLNFLLELL